MPRLRHVLAAAAALAALPAGTASAATLVVNDDAYGCAGTTAGFTKVQAAIDAAAPGDTIRVCYGHYAEQLRVQGKPLTIEEAPGEVVQVRFPAAPTKEKLPGETWDSSVLLRADDSSHLVVRGIDLAGNGSQVTATAYGAAFTGSDVRLEDVRFQGIWGYSTRLLRHDVQNGSTRSLELDRITTEPIYGGQVVLNGRTTRKRTITRSTFLGKAGAGYPGIDGESADISDSTFKGFAVDGWDSCGGFEGGVAVSVSAADSPVFARNTFEGTTCAFEGLYGDSTQKVTFRENRMVGGEEFAYLGDVDADVLGNELVDVRNAIWHQDIGTSSGSMESRYVGNTFVRSELRFDDVADPQGAAGSWEVRDNRFLGGRAVFLGTKQPASLRANWWGCAGTAGDAGCSTVYSHGAAPDTSQPLRLVAEAGGALRPGEPGPVRAALRRADGSLAAGLTGVPVGLSASAGELSDEQPRTKGGQAYATLTAPAGPVQLAATLDGVTAKAALQVAPAPPAEKEVVTETKVVEVPVVVTVPGPVVTVPGAAGTGTKAAPVAKLEVAKATLLGGRRIRLAVRVPAAGVLRATVGKATAKATVKRAATTTVVVRAARKGTAKVALAFTPAAGGATVRATAAVKVSR